METRRTGKRCPYQYVPAGKQEGVRFIKRLVAARYERNDTELAPGRFRVKGDTISVIPAYSQDVVRISLFGNEVEKISVLDAVSLREKQEVPQIRIFPAKHYLIASDVRKKGRKVDKDGAKRAAAGAKRAGKAEAGDENKL